MGESKIYVRPKLIANKAQGTKLTRAWRAERNYRAQLQGNKCSICDECVDNSNITLDHDHSNGKLRSALCRLCNLGLGVFRDDAVRLLKAIHYLKKWEAKSAEKCLTVDDLLVQLADPGWDVPELEPTHIDEVRDVVLVNS